MYISEDNSATYKLFKKHLHKMGYTSSENTENDRLVVTFVSPSGKIWKTPAAHIAYPFATRKIRDISVNKEQAYDFAKKIGLTTPFTRCLLESEKIADEELTILLNKYKKLVVKPADSSLARGLTVGISDIASLRKAIDYAHQISPKVLIQEQVEGEEIRFAVIDGKVEAALLRRTPRVVGDGHSTIQDLIKAENEIRKSLIFEHVSYPQLTSRIIDKSYIASKKIPKRGEIVEFSRATMIKNGCSVFDVIGQVDKSYIEIVEKTAKALGARFIVVDIFVKDYTKPRNDNNYWFIEFNTAPVIKLFYGCRDGNMFDILPKLAALIDRCLNEGK